MRRKGYDKDEMEYRNELLKNGIAICSTCRRELPLNSFTNAKGSSRGVSYECKECQKILRETRKAYRKEWENKNKEKLKEYHTNYYDEHKTERKLKQKEKAKTDEYQTWKKRYDRRLTTRYRRYKQLASSRHLEFELIFEDFEEISTQACHYCGSLNEDEFGNLYSGIDRIDSTNGYTLNNVVPCCAMCNRMKNKRNVNSWIERMSQILSHLNSIGYISPSPDNPNELQFNDELFEQLTKEIQKC
jgi:hypothetical protein